MATDSQLRASEIKGVLLSEIANYEDLLHAEEVGEVLEVKDGIARIYGLTKAMASEMLEITSTKTGETVTALALNLEEDNIGAVILGNWTGLHEGDQVRRTGRVLEVPVGAGYLGRVVDALGQPLDGLGPVDPLEGSRQIDVVAPGIVKRQPVKEPLQTGLKAIDAMIPIGRGQRELIIGDRQVGKTAVAIDTIINQRGLWGTDRQVKCIYVAIGQKGSTVAEIVARLEANGALDYTTVVNAPASSAAPFQYIAPYAGCAIGSYWMYNGEHALIIYDDLSKQADAYRQLSLLLRRPPGREAYPGDVFYLHSRLLERSAKLSDELGGGSLTGLPIIETKGGDVSAFIPTNVISITDGQIYLETDLFFQGVRPAINAGISVSRVGGDAQIKAMKTVSGTMRLDLAQYRDLEAFASFGSELDQASQDQLDRGERTVEVLKQPQYAPVPVEEQVIVVWAVTNGRLDDVPVEEVQTFNERLREHVRNRHTDLLEHLRTEGTLGDDVEEQVADAVDGFKHSFSADADEDFDIDDRAEDDLGDEVERAHGEAQDDPATGTSDVVVGRDDGDDDVVDDDDATDEVADTSDGGTTDEDTADRAGDVVDEDPAQDTTDEDTADRAGDVVDEDPAQDTTDEVTDDDDNR